MAPQTQLLMSSGSTEEEPQYTFSLSLKIPSKQTPPGSPTGPFGESCLLTRPFFFFYISLKFLIKIPPNKEIYPFSQRPKERSIPPCSPEAEPLWKQMSISRALFSISFRVTSKETPPPGAPHRSPSERDLYL